MGWWLDAVTAAAALAAATFWILSAADQPPMLTTNWDFMPNTDPFVQWLRAGIKWNRLAALSAGISAAATSIATVLQMRETGERQ